MLWRKGLVAILPCAGITLIRFTGMISDYAAFGGINTPGTCLSSGQAIKISKLS